MLTPISWMPRVLHSSKHALRVRNQKAQQFEFGMPHLDRVAVDTDAAADRIDRQRAADLNLSIDQIGRTLETLFGGRQVNTFVDRGEEYDVILQGADAQRRTPGDLDGKRLNDWISDLLRTKGGDIYRMKGVLSVKGTNKRLVFQGVHMLFDAKFDREWRDGENRTNTLVFIGKNLDRNALTEAFKACLAG